MMTDLEKLIELLESFDCGMLITQDHARRVVSRPMAIADVSDSGKVVLVTAAESEKVDEIREHPEVNFCCQKGEERFVSVSGVGRVVDDPPKLKDVWNSELQAWFPDGPEGSSAVLIEIEPSFGEYWDQSGFGKAAYMFELGRAYVTGDKPELGEESHGKVALD